MQKYKVYLNNKYKIISNDWENFCANYKLIYAAGGVVKNSKNQILMIFKNGKWDLPKGKIENGEKIIDCALREVHEECGVSKLQIINQLQNTYHIYKINNHEVLKCTYWFSMFTNYNKKLFPQINEGITNCEWIGEERISEILEKSHANIKDFLVF